RCVFRNRWSWIDVAGRRNSLNGIGGEKGLRSRIQVWGAGVLVRGNRRLKIKDIRALKREKGGGSWRFLRRIGCLIALKAMGMVVVFMIVWIVCVVERRDAI